MTLPTWLTQNKKGVFVVDPNIAYTEVMKGLKITPAMLDQYWMEVVYQSTKLEVVRIVKAEGLDPRPDKVLVIDILSNKGKWALNKFKPGKGVLAANQGKEAREHYRKWRGFVPE